MGKHRSSDISHLSSACIAVIDAGAWGKNLIRNFNELDVLKTICDVKEEIHLNE